MCQCTDEVLAKHRSGGSSLIAILQDIQKNFSYLPEDALETLSRNFRIPLSEIYSVATFYTQFKFEKPGKHHIRVCHGTACHINGAVGVSESIEQELGIPAGKTTGDGSFSIENVACLGCCSLSPVLMVGEKVFGKLDRKNSERLVRDLRAGKSV
jgi:NADH-quinone oxidoreductase subunit E